MRESAGESWSPPWCNGRPLARGEFSGRLAAAKLWALPATVVGILYGGVGDLLGLAEGTGARVLFDDLGDDLW